MTDRLRLVVAEDDPLIVRLLDATFRDGPWALRVTTTGPETVAVVRDALPGLVLLDVGLPEMDGYDVCRHLKDDPATVAIPVVMLTARASQRDRELAEAAGADGYLTKPFSPSELRQVVGSWLPQVDAT